MKLKRESNIYGKPRLKNLMNSLILEYNLRNMNHKKGFAKPLSENFFRRDTAIVAKDLLGKILVRKLPSRTLSGKIVETEAYFGKEDPASRAYLGRPKFCVKLMHEKPGRTLIYMVHGNWLLNIIAHERSKAGAVLIRALEPLKGIETMKKNRGIENINNLTNGPGKLTKALNITKELNGIDVTNEKSEIQIVEGKEEDFEIGSSFRIGVREDLSQHFRFFIKGNKFVSK